MFACQADLPLTVTAGGDGGHRIADPRLTILAAMVSTVADRGYARTTVEDVLRRAGVSRELFGEHFIGKEECLIAALDVSVEKLMEVVADAYCVDAPWPQRIYQALQSFLLALASNPELTRVAMVECLSAGPVAYEHYRAAFTAFVPIFEDGRKHAGAAQPSERVAETVVTGIAAMVQRRVREGHIEQLVDLLPDLVYFALVPYVGNEPATAAARLPLAA